LTAIEKGAADDNVEDDDAAAARDSSLNGAPGLKDKRRGESVHIYNARKWKAQKSQE
jgi:hypothetical protein